jgi:hypothetical protein
MCDIYLFIFICDVRLAVGWTWEACFNGYLEDLAKLHEWKVLKDLLRFGVTVFVAGLSWLVRVHLPEDPPPVCSEVVTV